MMTQKNNTVRKNVYLSQEINDWLVKESEKMGIAQSNLISIAVHQYMKQSQAPDMINDLKKLVEQMEKKTTE